MNDRDRALAWLVERLTGAALPDAVVEWRDEIAAAILSQPDVKIEVDRVRLYSDSVEVRNPPPGMRATHVQIVIRLPLEPDHD